MDANMRFAGVVRWWQVPGSTGDGIQQGLMKETAGDRLSEKDASPYIGVAIHNELYSALSKLGNAAKRGSCGGSLLPVKVTSCDSFFAESWDSTADTHLSPPWWLSDMCFAQYKSGAKALEMRPGRAARWRWTINRGVVCTSN
ncbi:hypothetical protein IF2G_10507 [Cordyceps javanica]|nr:hypothetical protein IF2G_10507 [Cordyceps javanica]